MQTNRHNRRHNRGFIGRDAISAGFGRWECLRFWELLQAATVNPETSYIPLGDHFAAQIVLSLLLFEEITQDASPAKALRPVARASPRLFRSKTVLSIWKTSSWILMLYQKSPTIYKYYLPVYLTHYGHLPCPFTVYLTRSPQSFLGCLRWV